ncbi:MAG: hypothetical protein ACE361_26615 [Aureliella sp.]
MKYLCTAAIILISTASIGQAQDFGFTLETLPPAPASVLETQLGNASIKPNNQDADGFAPVPPPLPTDGSGSAASGMQDKDSNTNSSLPPDYSAGSYEDSTDVRAPAPKMFLFKSGQFYHPKLYFEQPMLERHGATKSKFFQPLISAGHFIRSSVTYPFVSIWGARQSETSTGWGTPGSRLVAPQ